MMTNTSLSASTSPNQGPLRSAARRKWHRHSCLSRGVRWQPKGLCVVAKPRTQPTEAAPSLPSESRKLCPQFLIANPELEFKLSPIRINNLKFPNRKLFALFYPEVRRGHLAPPDFHPKSLVTSHSSLATEFLINPPRLEIPPTHTKQTPAPNSNRDKNHPKKNIIPTMASPAHDSDRSGLAPDFQLLIDSAPALIHTSLPDGYLDFFNQSWLEYVGLSLEELKGWKWTVAIHPDDVEGIVAVWRESLASGKPFLYEARVRRADGEYRWMLHHKVAIRDEHGNITKWNGSSIDIEDRKHAEETLRRSEAYLTEAQRLSHTGSFGWRPDTGEIVWSDETYRIFEYDRSVKPTIDSLEQRIHPEDRTDFKEVISRAFAGAPEFEHAYRLLLPDGRVKHVHALAHVLRDASGSREFVGAVTDITERKTAEDKIREQEAELRQILDLAPWHVAVLGADGKAMYLNKAGLDYHGLTREAWQDYDPHRLIHPDDHDRILTGAGQAKLLSDQPFEIEARLVNKNGESRWFLFRFNPLLDGGGRISRWYVTSTDIEDRRRTEERLQNENVALREEIDKASMFEEIVGTSPALKSVLSRISKVAPSDSTVLITGETGTGKELVARAIHRRSSRALRPFVSVNCAAVPRDLIASELFGHEKGAFTGALQRRIGRFELAEGGTIFLDEVGELSAETQVALLRVLQEREFERVGGNQLIRANVRVIAATNRDLEVAIGAGSFRRDLFYRLSVFPIESPPLRERKSDIPMLVEYFIDRYARKVGKRIRNVEKSTMQLLSAYSWPGNIRELQNVMERSVILCDGETISVDPSWLSLESTTAQQKSQPFGKKSAAQEKQTIEAALTNTGGRVSGPAGAAAALGLPASTLESKIRSLGINKFRFKRASS
jgi:PAS domain S-box-containing protein